MSSKACLILVLVVIGLLGTVFLGVSFIISHFQKKNSAECTVKTKARIIEVKKEEMGSQRYHDRGISWFPVYQYTAAGKIRTVKSNYGGLESDYTVGEWVPLYYSPENPEHIYIPGGTANKLILIFRLIGIGLLAAEAVTIFLV